MFLCLLSDFASCQLLLLPLEMPLLTWSLGGHAFWLLLSAIGVHLFWRVLHFCSYGWVSRSGFIVSSFLLSGWFSSVTFSLLSDYHHSLSDRIAGWLTTDMDNQVPVLDFFCTWFLGLQLLKFWTKLVSSNLFLLLSWSCSLKLLDQQNCFLTCKVVLANYACYYYLIGQ